MVPLLNRPILEYYVFQIAKAEINDIKIILHQFPEQVDHYFKDGKPWGVNISYSLEKQLLGDFRSLRKIRSFLGETFIFGDAQFFLLTDWNDVVERHKKSGKKISVVCKQFNPVKNYHAIDFDPQKNLLKTIRPIEKSVKEDKVFILTGLYVFEPEILNYLDNKSINSISKDLIPQLLKDNEPINVIEIDGIFEPLTTLHYYWELNMNLLERGSLKEWIDGKEISPGIFVGENCKTKINLKEEAVGPILIGKNAEICREVNIRGPVIIGNNVKIDRGATIDHSIILDSTYVGKMVELKDSVVAKNCYISVKALFGTFVEENFIISEYLKEPFRVKRDRFIIGLIDRVVALIALILLSPLFLIIAILIKLDSPGPVFYVSKRLKRPKLESKDENHYQFVKEEAVKYYVFRTMYTDADRRLKELETKNIYDSGPYRKIENDPRVTRIGRFLRKTSLDELPLLINVLKGDMSLVGVWALPTYEAEALQAEGLKSSDLDLSEMARVRFEGRLGLAGLWQARGRSELSAEERALHDSFQSALISLSNSVEDQLGEYREYISLKGYLKLLWETFIAVIKRKGAQ